MNYQYKLLFLLLLPFCCSCQNTDYKCNPNIQNIYQEYDYNKLNKNWLKDDLEFGYQLKLILKSDNKENIKLIIPIDKNDKKIKLINNFTLIKENYGKGYFDLFYEYVLNNNRLISYKLIINRKEFLLLKHYEIDLSDLFVLDKEENSYIFIYNIDEVSKPYKEIPSIKDVNKNIKFYMSPFSGIRYGCRGGYGNIIIDNRCAFKQIENDLTTQDIFYILHSINPASRLTAIEFYYKNKDRFKKEEQEKIEILIEDIFKEMGNEIEVLNGDIVLYDSPRNAVKKQLESDCY